MGRNFRCESSLLLDFGSDSVLYGVNSKFGSSSEMDRVMVVDLVVVVRVGGERVGWGRRKA